MNVLRYRLHLDQPVLATALQDNPNSSVSHPYIPGGTVRGWFVARYLERNPHIQNLLTDIQGYRLFFSGAVRYLHAYPVVEDQRALPTPLGVMRRKGDYKSLIYDTAHLKFDDLARQLATDNGKYRLEAARASFCRFTGAGVVLHTPERTLAVHIQRDSRKGRATRNEGAVFQYQALAQDQTFEGVIVVEDQNDILELQALLSPAHGWMGRSRSAEYGRVRFVRHQADFAWQEWVQPVATTVASASQHNGFYTLTLLSDLIAFNENGTPVVHVTPDVLSTVLGHQVTEVDNTHTFTQITLVGGFNRKWQLPYLQEYALSAGSVIVFKTETPLTESEITRLEEQGCGARRVEGFGRLTLSWQRALSNRLLEEEPEWEADDAAVLTGAAQTLAEVMSQRHLTRQIEQATLRFMQRLTMANQTTPWKDWPSNHQIARLQTAIRSALVARPIDVGQVKETYNKFEQTAKRQFQRTRLGGKGQSLDHWMNTLLESPTKVWQPEWLGISTHQWLPGVTLPLTEDMERSRRTALELIATVLAYPATQRKGEKEVANGESSLE